MAPPLRDPRAVLGSVRSELERTGRRVGNGVRVLTGQEKVEVASTPRREIWRSGIVILYKYDAVEPLADAPPVLLVMSLVTKPDIFDLMPDLGVSLVRAMQSRGLRVYLLDWGVPGPAEAKNTIADYTLNYLPRAVHEVVADAEAVNVNLFCYCMGGTLALVTAAADPKLPIAGILSVATAIDFTKLGPIPNLVRNGRLEIQHVADEHGNVPPAVLARAIKLVKPTGDVTTMLSLWDALADRQALYAHRALLGWAGAHIPFPGAAAQEIVELCMRQNLLAQGELPLGRQTAYLRDINCRVFSVFGTEDALVPPGAHNMLGSLLDAPFRELSLPTGHVGLFVGRQARHATKAMLEWLLDTDRGEPATADRKG